jgi:hypothetical protein
MMSFLDITPETIRKGHYPDVSASLLAANLSGAQTESESLTGSESHTGSVAGRSGSEIIESNALIDSDALIDSNALTGSESLIGSESRTGSVVGRSGSEAQIDSLINNNELIDSESRTDSESLTGSESRTGSVAGHSGGGNALIESESLTDSESLIGREGSPGSESRTAGLTAEGVADSSVNNSATPNLVAGSPLAGKIRTARESLTGHELSGPGVVTRTEMALHHGQAPGGESHNNAPSPNDRFPFVKGVISSLNRRIRKCTVVQDGHSSVEELLYQMLWREAEPNVSNPSGSRTLRMGYAELASKSRLHKTNVRLNLLSLKAKLAIDILDEYNSRDLVPRLYRIFSYKEILERRKIADLHYVIRQKNVIFVSSTGEPILLPGLHSATKKTKSGQQSAKTSPTPPVSETHTGGESSLAFIDPRWIYDMFAKYAPHVDQAAVFKLISSCQEQRPDVTQAELVDALCIKGEQVARSGSAQNPIAVLLKAVPEWIGDPTFTLRRVQIRRRASLAAAQDQLQFMQSAVLEKLQQLPRNDNWEQIRSYLRKVVDPHSFEIWLTPLVRAWEINGVLSVLLPADRFHVVATKFATEVSQAIELLSLNISEINYLDPEEAYLALGCRP